MCKEVVLPTGYRTAIGKMGGTLIDIPAAKPGSIYQPGSFFPGQRICSLEKLDMTKTPNDKLRLSEKYPVKKRYRSR